ncbi:MAG TPA: bacillithiol system redox-active protein YtxJ [Bacillota bacterium]|nr:bacillithiol system redox-active protein YtxJ [Bacillota bacterium]
MITLHELTSMNELEKVWEETTEKPVLLFKHSTTCPLSAQAMNEYQSFLQSLDKDVSAYMVKVIEERPISNKIAEWTEVRHHSPQILLVKDKEVLWHTSHTKITTKNMDKAFERAKIH